MKRLLLDTHVWLWLGPTPEKIAPDVLSILEDPANVLFLSAASSWEISIKYRLGKLPLPEPPNRFIADRLLRDGIQFLPIELHHTVRVADLPDHCMCAAVDGRYCEEARPSRRQAVPYHIP